MPSSPQGFWVIGSLVFSLLTGCSQLGERDPLQTLLEFNGGVGCLNQVGQKLESYIEGTLENKELQSTWKCLDDTISLFQRFVRGRGPDQTYTSEDLHDLLTRFLITDREVRPELSKSILELKAAWFGGNTQVLTQGELFDFLKLLSRLRDESLRLNRTFQKLSYSRDRQTLLELHREISRSGRELSLALDAPNRAYLKIDQVLQAIREFGRVLDYDVTLLQPWEDSLSRIKVVFFGGDRQIWEPSDWNKLLLESANLGSAFWAYQISTDPETVLRGLNERGELWNDLLHSASDTFLRGLQRNGGRVSNLLLQNIIRTLPLESFTVGKKEAVVEALPRALHKLGGSKSEEFLDGQVLQVVLEHFDRGTRGQSHLERIFQNLRSTVTPFEFDQAASRYEENFTDAKELREIRRLRTLASSTIGLYPEDGEEIRFGSDTRSSHSRNSLIKLQWYQIIIARVLQVYSNELDRTRGRVQAMETLVSDYGKVLVEYAKIHPRLAFSEVAKKRFREANLFMPSSNGDEFLDEREGTYYLAFLMSAGSQSQRVYEKISREYCPLGPVDEMGLPTMEAACFRRAYFMNFEEFWDSYPELKRSYRAMGPAQRESLQKSLEISARMDGYSSKPISQYDIDGFTMVPHYVENLIGRFDTNGNQLVDTQEILRLAYPVFQNSLRELSGQSREWILQAALTYLLRFGRQPRGFWQTAHFFAWVAWRPFWRVRASRGVLYQVVSVLSSPSG